MKSIRLNIRRSLPSALFVLLIMIVTTGELCSQSDRRHLREGNRDYRAGRFSDSELSYRRAAEVIRGTPDAWFNLGNSMYRQERFEDAAESFRKNASLNDGAAYKANSYYNLGNSLLSGGKIEESIESYKNSLRLNPDNPEAKFNLAYAQNLLREQEQAEGQNQNERGEDQEQEQNQKDQESGDQKDQNQEEQSSQQQRDDQQQVISEEDARRLLEALVENEKELQEKVKKDKAAATRVRILKNW